jgi:hypothetical protein
VSYGAEKICFLYANQDSTILRAPAASRFEEAGLEGCCENGEFAGGWFGVGDELGNPGCKVLTAGGAWVGGAEAGTDGKPEEGAGAEGADGVLERSKTTRDTPAKEPKARNAATIGSTGFVEPDIEAL